MAILRPADDAPARGGMLNKRLLRVALAAGLLLSGALVLVARDDRARRVPPPPPRRGHASPAGGYLFASTSRFAPPRVGGDGAAAASGRDLCASFPSHMLNLVQPVLKVGHSEDRDRLAAHFDTTSSCFGADELLVVSDLDDVVHGHRAVDVLADLPAGYHDLRRNRDFRHYMAQKAMRLNGTLDDHHHHHHHHPAPKSIDGWILDKYKFLPMVERAWVARPGRGFYFFYEADTYVFWDNAFRLLQNLDPDAPIYMGSPSPGRRDEGRNVQTWFANGGPGFVLSRGAIRALLHRRADASGHYTDPSLAEKWLDLVAGECCGDSVLGWALWNVTVQVQGYWPMFNPHPLHGIPFSDAYWCQPVLTLHKSSPRDAHSLWRWEFAHRRPHRPMLYADVWRLQHPGEPTLLDDWDNGDWDRWDPPAGAAINDAEACGRYCREEDRCLQWTWRGGDDRTCILMSSIRYGAARPPEYMDDDGGRQAIPPEASGREAGRKWVDYKSGWVQGRIREWREQRRCEEVHWPGPSVDRIF